MMRPFLLLLFGVISFSVGAQAKKDFPKHRFKVVAEIPVQFGLGYEVNYSRRFSSNFQLGILTNPNSQIILYSLQTLGTSQEVVLMLQDAFKFGVVAKGTFQYNFKRNYVGGFIQLINLTGKDTPTALVEGALNVDINSYPRYKGTSSSNENTLTLKSQIIQAGVLYGRRFPLGRRSEIDTEFGISANIGSSSSLFSEVRNLNALSNYTNTYLNSIYRSYAFIPSITIAYAIKIGK